MKVKHLIATLSLTLAMGLGVGAALLANQSSQVAKAEESIQVEYFLDLSTDGSCGNYWNDAGAYTYVYAYNDAENLTNGSWPGQRVFNYFSYDQHLKIFHFYLDENLTNMIFIRVNPEFDGTNWNDSYAWNRSSADQGTPIRLPVADSKVSPRAFVVNYYDLQQPDGNAIGTWKKSEFDVTAHVKQPNGTVEDVIVKSYKYKDQIAHPVVEWGQSFNGYWSDSERHEWAYAFDINDDNQELYGEIYNLKQKTYFYDFTNVASDLPNLPGLQVRMHLQDTLATSDHFFTIDNSLIGSFTCYDYVNLYFDESLGQGLDTEHVIVSYQIYVSTYNNDKLLFRIEESQYSDTLFYHLNWYTDGLYPDSDGYYLITNSSYRFDNVTHDDASNPQFYKFETLENDPNGYVAVYRNFHFVYDKEYNYQQIVAVRSYFNGVDNYHNLDNPSNYAFINQTSYSSMRIGEVDYYFYTVKQSVNLDIYVKSNGDYHYEISNGVSACVYYSLFSPNYVGTSDSYTSFIVYEGETFEPELESELNFDKVDDVTMINTNELYYDPQCTQPYTPTELDENTTLYAKCYHDGAYLIGDAHYTGSASTAWKIEAGQLLQEVGEGDESMDEEAHTYSTTVYMTADANIPTDTTRSNPTKIAALYMLDMFGGYEAYKTSPQYADFTFDKAYDFASIDDSTTNQMKMVFNRGGDFTLNFAVSITMQFDDDFRQVIGMNISVVASIALADNSLDTFITNFLTEIGGVCKMDNTTDPEALAAAWEAQAQAFDALTASEKTIIRAVTISGGNEEGSTLEQMIAKYALVLSRYSNLDDFIFGQQSGSNIVNKVNADSQTIIVVISALAMTSLIVAFGLKLYYSKKKHQ